jgi:hypothetical protein
VAFSSHNFVQIAVISDPDQQQSAARPWPHANQTLG